jgi:hypothetical protein
MSEAARGTDTMTDGFADLICADPLLLRAEFEGLIAASWDSEPPTPPTGTRTLVGVVDPGQRPDGLVSAIESAARPRWRPLRIDEQGHQRSPPAGRR